MIGELADPADIRVLNRIMASISDVLKKLKKCMNESQETWMRLLIGSYAYLNNAQLVRGIAKAFNITSSKSPVIVELVSHLKTFQTELDLLKTAKRNAVILVLDKVPSSILSSLEISISIYFALDYYRWYKSCHGKAWPF